MSRKALSKFAKIVRASYHDLFYPDSYIEDVEMGRALRHQAIFVESRDENRQERFFHLAVGYHMEKERADWWFFHNMYYNVAQGGTKGVSDVPIMFHYIDPRTMYQMNYFIYYVHPFGLEKNLTETLPRKLSLKEIIAGSDVKSFSRFTVNHTDRHDMDPSEIY